MRFYLVDATAVVMGTQEETPTSGEVVSGSAVWVGATEWIEVHTDSITTTSSEASDFLTHLADQGMTEVTVRLRAYNDWDTGAEAAETSTVKMIIEIATIKGLEINLDMHTWFTTWDSNFRDTAGTAAVVGANRSAYLSYVETTIQAYAGEPIKAWMCLNEPQFAYGTSGENYFLNRVIDTAQATTSAPCSIRFMGGASPFDSTTSNHYASNLRTKLDFMCINAYWDAAYSANEVFSCGMNDIIEARDVAHVQSKEVWITEYGVSSSPAQKSTYFVDNRAWQVSNQIDRTFAWVCQPDSGTGEKYNLFSGYTPMSAFYALGNVPK